MINTDFTLNLNMKQKQNAKIVKSTKIFLIKYDCQMYNYYKN